MKLLSLGASLNMYIATEPYSALCVATCTLLHDTKAYIEKVSVKEFENTHRPRPYLGTYCIWKGARSLHISVENHDTHTETGKFICKALALHGKQLLLKRD